MKKYPRQIVGNIGLYYVCYELSKRGWNVMPTTRNAKGVDVVIYSQDGKRKFTIQIKSLSKRNPVPLGTNLENLKIVDYLIICRNVIENPELFIIRIDELLQSNRIHQGEKEGRVSYWIEPKDYEDLKDKWEELESGV